MMFRSHAECAADAPLRVLDRVVVCYLSLPVVIFLATWLRWWLAVPTLASVVCALRPLLARVPAPLPGSRKWQIVVATGVACGWAFLGGIDHFVFANADWYIRDGVLHDLVASAWPVGYGATPGGHSVLRAPLAFYLPAALVGKIFGLSAAHFALLVWSASGASLFLLQVLTITSPRRKFVAVVLLVIVMFSGLDIVGWLLNGGARFRHEWQIWDHLEWWAASYQFSSMTTLLFWVPNHTLAAWLMVGMLYRCRGSVAFVQVLPMLVVIVALWSPFTAIGIAPFAAAAVFADLRSRRTWGALRPAVWAPAMLVALVLGAYLATGARDIPNGIGITSDGEAWQSLLRYAEFFLLEAGFLGAAIYATRRASELLIALAILAVLPWASFGASNDLAMRASIPSITVMAMCAALALSDASGRRLMTHKSVLIALLAIGAVTPLQEIMRALLLPRWPVNLRGTLVDAFCGWRPPHYVAQVGPYWLLGGMRDIHVIEVVPTRPESCRNPALEIMRKARQPIPD